MFWFILSGIKDPEEEAAGVGGRAFTFPFLRFKLKRNFSFYGFVQDCFWARFNKRAQETLVKNIFSHGAKEKK